MTDTPPALPQRQSKAPTGAAQPPPPRYAMAADTTTVLSIMQILNRISLARARALERFGIGEASKWLPRRDQRTLQAAQAARDTGRWKEAALLFEQIAAGHPHRDDIKIQVGNCAKESGEYLKAYETFRSIRDPWHLPEAELQIGHLFKVTGNLNAAKFAFERARALGDKDAVVECDSYGPSWLDTVRCSKRPGPAEHPSPWEGLRDLLALDFEREPSSQSTRKMGDLSRRLGERITAKAFYELEFLMSADRRMHFDQVEAAINTGIWPPGDILAMKRAARAFESSGFSDARDRLRNLIAAALPEPDVADEAEPPRARMRVEPTSRPEPLDAQAGRAALSTVSAMITRAYLASMGGSSSAEFVAATRELRGHVLAMEKRIALAMTASVESYQLHATRILLDRTAFWLEQTKSAYEGSRVTPLLIEAFLAAGPNAVVERLSAHTSPAALFDEMTNMLVGLGEPAERHDRVLARVLTIAAPDLSMAEVRGLFDEAARRHFYAAALALVERQMAFADADIVEIAARYKQAGQARTALTLLQRHFQDGAEESAARLEAALVAKTCGDFATAARFLEACAIEQPDNEFVKRELIAVLPELEPIEDILARFSGDPTFLRLAAERHAYRIQMTRSRDGDGIGMLAVEERLRVVDLEPEIATEFLTPLRRDDREGILWLRVGWMTKPGPGLNETRPLLRRHDFVRVRTAFREPVPRLRVRIDGRTVGSTTGVAQRTELRNDRLHRSMFNCWFDLSDVPEGLHELQLYFEEAGGGYRTHEETVWVDPSPPSEAAMASTATVDLSGDDGRGSLEERIARRPSAVFPAARRLLDKPPRRILVMRVDQLGDLTVSLPAMLLLRDRFPDAELSCLVSPNYVSLVRELGIFAEVFTIEFPYEQSARKRHITLARQAELRRELGSREFDIAIDLCFGHMTRPLLRLAQAKCTVGFWPQEFPWLDFGLDVRSRDVVTGGYRLPQQALCNLLIDGLWSAAQHTSVHRVRPDLDWSALEPFGIEPETPYFLLHTGVRTPARRWPIPHFVALARLLVARTGHRVIMVADEPALFDDDSRALLAIDGIHLIDHRLSFDVLDTLISLCAVYVATDSGPKHLAAYRGVPVVSIQHGPLSWSEWGQDGVGLIIAHRVPCSGCGVELAEDCGKDMICVSSITPETVFQAVQAEMRRSAAESAEARRTSRDLGSIAEILETDEAVGVVDFDP